MKNWNKAEVAAIDKYIILPYDTQSVRNNKPTV